MTYQLSVVLPYDAFVGVCIVIVAGAIIFKIGYYLYKLIPFVG